MARLEIFSLGTFQSRLDGREIHGYESDKVRLLLIYLLVEKDHPHRREKLAALFWPDMSETVARTNLRRALSNLRKTIQDHKSSPPFLCITRQTLQIHPAADIWHDMQVVSQEIGGFSQNLDRLEIVAGLGRGEFLAGLNTRGCLDLEEWLLLQREQAARNMVALLQAISQLCLQNGEYARAIPFARRRVDLEPWQEEGHRQLMRLLAYDGQRGAALRQFERCRQFLKESLGVQPEKATSKIYARIRAAGSQQPDSVPQHNLPASLTPLIGREEELARLHACLNDPDCRLMTLTGPGGAGKTRLALEAASAQTENYSNAVYFVPLSEIKEVEGIVTAVAEAVGLSLPGDNRRRARLNEYFRANRVLLVLDNFEHLIDGAALVSTLLQGAQNLKIIATSRIQLNLPGEHLLPLTGLLIPQRDDPEAAGKGAVKLFVDSARRIEPDFEISEAGLTAVIEICRQVSGLPLAILLAASWSQILTPVEILAEIQTSLDLFEVDWQGIPERHRSLRVVMQNSWAMLSQRDQNGLKGLAVFTGGFNRKAAADIAGVSLSSLRRFVTHSLVNHSATGRYYLHNLMAQFALEKLAEVEADEKNVRERHSSFFCRKAADWDAGLKGPTQQAALAAMSADAENMRAAWDWVVGRKDADRMLMAVDGLCRFFEWRVRYQEGLAACRQGMAALTKVVKEETVCRAMVRLIGWEGEFARRLESEQSTRAGLTRAEPYVKWLAQAKRPSDWERGWLSLVEGRIFSVSDREKARASFQDSLKVFRRAGDRWHEANLLSCLGSVAWNLGDYEAAATHHQASLEIKRALKDWQSVARTNMSLGLTRLHQGRFEEAEKLVAEGGRIRSEMGDQRGIADAIRFLGVTKMAMGKFSEAENDLQAAVTIYDALGLPFGLERAMLANAVAHQGRVEEAKALCERGLALARQTGYHRALGYSLLVQGELALADGRLQLASSALKESISHYEFVCQRDEWGRALASQAVLAMKQKDYPAAGTFLQRGVHLARACRAALPMIYLLPVQGLWYANQGDPIRAEQALGLAAGWPLVTESRWFEAILGEVWEILRDRVARGLGNGRDFTEIRGELATFDR